MKSEIESFFDRLASNWDKDNHLPPASLLSRIGIQKGERVLDVACGSGIITEELQKQSGEPVLGIDISIEMIRSAERKYQGNENVSFLKADFCQYRAPKPFDVIVIYNAFPHFADVEALKESLLANLKKGGRVAILHSLSREELSHHHNGLSSSISRELQEPLAEAKAFFPEFECLNSDEGEHHYFILLKKR